MPHPPPTLESAPRRRAPHLAYVPGIDGLRALAVVSVILYHLDVAWIPGGFLGVEVFFVISGYLITSLLLAEQRKAGRVDLGGFWQRRARRLLPALYVLLAAAAVTFAVFLRDEAASLRGDIAAAFAYVTNWYQIIAERSYFESSGRPSPLQHLWSLAVEEQFYLLFPLLFVGGLALFGRRRLPWVLFGAAVASAVWMAVLYTPGADPSRVYYGTDTRASGLLLGAVAAFAWSPWRLRRDVAPGAKVVLNGAGLAALAALGWMHLTVSEFDPWLYRGGFFLLGLLTLVVIAVAVHPGAHVGRVLALPALVWIGVRSYSLYLWHWPVVTLTRPDADVPFDGWPLLVVRAALTVGLAELSFRFVETPIRTGALSRRWARLRATEGLTRRRLTFRWGFLTTFAVGVCALLAVTLVQADRPEVPDYLAFATEGGTLAPGFIAGPPTDGQSPAEAPATSTTAAPATTTTTTTSPSTTTTAGSGGGVATTTTAPTTAPAPPTTTAPLRILGVGDSVMLGAQPQMASVLGSGLLVNAEVGRSPQAGVEAVRWFRDTGQLGDVVVVHLGNNGPITDEQFTAMMDALSGVPRVIVLTCKVPRNWEGPVNDVILSHAGNYPNVRLVDWHSVGSAHPEYFYDDGMHLRPEGGTAYAQLIAAQL